MKEKAEVLLPVFKTGSFHGEEAAIGVLHQCYLDLGASMGCAEYVEHLTEVVLSLGSQLLRPTTSSGTRSCRHADGPCAAFYYLHHLL